MTFGWGKFAGAFVLSCSGLLAQQLTLPITTDRYFMLARALTA